MQEILTSFINVTSATGFWFYMGGVVSMGMVVGNRFDESYKGFKRSIVLLLPYFVMLFFVTSSRVYEVSRIRLLGADAYNSLITLGIVTFFYVLGLFIGHVILLKAKKEVHGNKV